MENKLIVILIMCLMLGGLLTTSVTTPFVDSKDFSVADGETSPIYINYNDNFSIYADSGAGIESNPYIISGDSLESFGDACIYIIDTDAYAVFNNTYLNGTGYYGIYLHNVSNVNITNSVIEQKAAGILIENCSRIFFNNVEINNRAGDDYGITIDFSDNISVRNCNITDATMGINLLNSFRVEIVDNDFVGSGLSFYGTCQVSTAILVTGNTINDKPLGYLYNHHDEAYNISGYGQVILVSCVNVTLYDGNLSDTNVAAQFIFCQNCIVQDSQVHENRIGVLLYESSYCQVLRNNITANRNGVVGYFAVGSIITQNNITYNTHIGLWAYYGCSSSVIYLNNFIGNTVNARDDGGIEDSNLIWAAIKFTNPLSGWPLNNVSITLEQGDRSYTGYSNENGLFKVPLPNTGPYNVTMDKFRYQTKTVLNYDDIQEGINYYDIQLTKDNFGPGTGYVLARFMDGAIPIVGASVKAYSYLDGAYYFHSNYTSAASPAGWVNITGLYYDDYVFIIEHEDYERRTINQVVISNGLVGTYNNIQLTPYPDDGYIYGWVYDDINYTSLSGANVTVYDSDISKTAFANGTGFYNITGLTFGVYQLEVSMTDYDTVVDEIPLYSYDYRCDFGLISSDYVPEEPLDAQVTNYDNGIVGNFWDDAGGVLVLAEESGIYEILGDNPDNPIDRYPLSEPHIIVEDIVEEPEEIWSDTVEIYVSGTPDSRIDVNTFGIVQFKLRWDSNGTEINNGLVLINVSGTDVDDIIQAVYIDGWWVCEYNYSQAAELTFSIYAVDCFGMTEFQQVCSDVEIIWDEVVVIITTTTTTTTTTTSIVTATKITDVVDFSDVILFTVGLSIGLVLVIVLFMKWFMKRR